MGKSHIVLFLTFVLNDFSAQSKPDLTQGCRPGYERLKPGSNCYQFRQKARKWRFALAWCKASVNGTTATLVEIQTPEEQSLITTALKKKKMESVWTGGNDIDEEGVFKWHDTTIGPYKPWYTANHHKGYANEDCIELRKDRDFLWDDKVCKKKKQFVCEHEPVVEKKKTECTDGWKDLNIKGNCYIFVQLWVHWFDAVTMCRDFGGHLLEVFSKAEHTKIIDELKLRKIPSVWLGGSDIFEEGVWRWQSDNRKITGYAPWCKKHSRNYGANEHCLATDQADAFDWNEQDCYSRLPFICQKKVT